MRLAEGQPPRSAVAPCVNEGLRTSKAGLIGLDSAMPEYIPTHDYIGYQHDLRLPRYCFTDTYEGSCSMRDSCDE